MDKPAAGSIRNILIQNVTATGGSIASSITGVDGGRVQDVTIDGLTVTPNGGSARRDLDVPEAPTKYPEATMFGELPALGVYSRHVDGLTIRNLKVHSAQPDARPSVMLDDVSRVEFSGFESTNVSPHEPQLMFRNVAGALLYGNRLSSAVDAFLSVVGAHSTDIALRANDLHLARKVFENSSDAPKAAVSVER